MLCDGCVCVGVVGVFGLFDVVVEGVVFEVLVVGDLVLGVGDCCGDEVVVLVLGVVGDDVGGCFGVGC